MLTSIQSRIIASNLLPTLAQRFGSILIGISAAMLPPYPAETAYFVTAEFVEQEQRNIIEALKRTESPSGLRSALTGRRSNGDPKSICLKTTLFPNSGPPIC